MEPKRTILFVDDLPMFRELGSLFLSRYGRVITAADGTEALEAVRRDQPDVVVLDFHLPDVDSEILCPRIRALCAPEKTSAIVALCNGEAADYERAIRAGARGYVMKLEAADVMIRAIRRVMNGGIYVSDDINERLLLGMATGRDGLVKSPLEVLSDRELEVFELTGRGYGTRDIAERLHLSVKTVESYRARIKNKLNLNSAAELMQHAVQWVEGEGAG